MNDVAAARVLVVEDDRKIAQLLVDYLRAAGHAPEAAGDGARALQLFRAAPPALVLMDLSLPGMDGMQLCRALRQESDVPIIMVTARVDEVDRLLGLETGADDYVCKPFSPREVVARVNAQLRRAANRLITQALPWQIDAAGQRVQWHGVFLPLTQVEYRLLILLLQHPGRIYSRAQLLDAIHDSFKEVSDRAIDSHIKNIRRKLNAAAAGSDCIASVYGVGYRLEFAD